MKFSCLDVFGLSYLLVTWVRNVQYTVSAKHGLYEFEQSRINTPLRMRYGRRMGCMGAPQQVGDRSCINTRKQRFHLHPLFAAV